MTINTSPVFKGTLDNGSITFTSADASNKKNLVNNSIAVLPYGTRIEGLVVCSDDTAAVNLAFYRYDGTTYFYIGNVSVPAGSGYTTVFAVNALQSLLAADLGYIDLKAGWRLACNCVATMTAGKTCTVSWFGGSFPYVMPTVAYGNNASGSGASVVASNAFALTDGNTAVVMITAGASSGWTLTSVTDTAGNLYTVLPVYSYGLSTYARIAYKVGAVGHAANVVTVSGSHPGGGTTQFQVLQFSGIAAFDAEAGRGDGPSLTADTQPVSISNRGIIVAVSGSTGGNSDSTISNGLVYVTPAAAHGSYAAGYRIYSGAASNQVFNFSGAGNTFRALAAASFL